MEQFIPVKDIRMIIHQYENPCMDEVFYDIQDMKYYMEVKKYTLLEIIREIDYYKFKTSKQNRDSRTKLLAMLCRKRYSRKIYTDVLSTDVW